MESTGRKNINALQPGQHEEHKIIRVGPNTLLLTFRPGVNFDDFYLGGRDLYCIHVSIPKQDDEMDVGSFVSLKYDSKCSLGNELVQEVKSETLVKIILTYIARTYPYVTSLRFTDSSEKTCDNWTSVALSDMSFITNGKTWYEKHFDAYIDEDSLEVYNREMESMKQKKHATTWETLLKKIPALHQFEDMRELYESSSSWHEFFGAIRDKLGGTPEFCMFASDWLREFMTRYLKIRFTKYTYMMPVKIYTDIAFTVEPYSSGGNKRRSTRRRGRRSQRAKH